MLSRRRFATGLGSVVITRPLRAAPSRRLALLFAAPWKNEQAWIGNDVDKMVVALKARGFGSADIVASADPLDRDRLLQRLAVVRQRISSWADGDVFVYYDGHGMYARDGGVPEPGLQLSETREDPSSALLWREFWNRLGAPPGVRVVALADCCHTNLLVGRLPRNVSALIMKSEPQDSLSCRTGTAFFGEGAARKRHGVVTYYAAGALLAASTLGDWLAGFDAAADRDIARGALERLRRTRLMVEGDLETVLPGRPVGVAARSQVP